MAFRGPTAIGPHRDSALRMRRIRAALGLTQRDWGYHLRVTPSAISAWENGRTEPSPMAEAQIRNVAVALGLDLHTMGRFR